MFDLAHQGSVSSAEAICLNITDLAFAQLGRATLLKNDILLSDYMSVVLEHALCVSVRCSKIHSAVC